MKNLHLNLVLIDYLIVIDNSEASGEIVLQAKNNVITHEVSHLPAWAKSIKETINKFASI